MVGRRFSIGHNTKFDDKDGSLTQAAGEGDIETVRHLVGTGADMEEVNPIGYTALMNAAANGHIETTRTLITLGAEVNALSGKDERFGLVLGETPLQNAVHNGHEAIVDLLLDNGADVNIADDLGRTPLMAAAQRGDAGIAETLCQHGADIDARDKEGTTALFDAVSYARMIEAPDVVKTLLDNGANPNIKGKDGDTPLIAASRSGHVKSAIHLAQHRTTKLNVKNNAGNTALICAAAKTIPEDIYDFPIDYPDIVTALLENGADSEICDRSGKTALQCAQQAGFTRSIDILNKEHEAKVQQALEWKKQRAQQKQESEFRQETARMTDKIKTVRRRGNRRPGASTRHKPKK